jgi:hypothetical protein
MLRNIVAHGGQGRRVPFINPFETASTASGVCSSLSRRGLAYFNPRIGDLTKLKREQVTIQLEIFLPSGVANVYNLTLFAQRSPLTPTFNVDPEKVDYYREAEVGDVSYSTKFVVDRYTGFAHEAQTILAKQTGKPPYTITGEYRCKKIDKPAF